MDEEPTYVEYTLDLITYHSHQVKTKEYETKKAKYLILNSEDTSNNGDNHYRSITLCPETKQILCYSPPKSLTPEEFKEKNQELNDTIFINEIIEGTMINLFYDSRIQSWEIGTKGAIGGNYWFFRNQYSIGNNEEFKEKKQPTFRRMFLDACRANDDDDINDLPFLEYLPKEYSYSFVLQHPANHITKRVLSPVVYLVAVYHLLDSRVVAIPQTVFEEWDCFLGIRGILEFPHRYEEETYEEVQNKYCSLDSPFDSVGIMFYNLKTGERMSMENEAYKKVRELRGNHPNLQYQYLCLRHSGKVVEFLGFFPQYKKIFYQFYKQYNDFVTQIHQSYVSYYVMKSGIRISKKYFPLVYKLHHEVFLPSSNMETGEKLIIRRAVVSEFIKGVEPNSLIYYLNYNKQEKEEKEEKEENMVL